MIGKAVEKSPRRFLPVHQVRTSARRGSAPNWTRDSILESIERSLRRLQTDVLDLVHLHSCSEAELRKGEAIVALQTARDRGHTRFIWIQWRRSCRALRGGMRRVRFAASFDQHRRPGSDRIEYAARTRARAGCDRETSNSKRGVEDGTQTRKLLSPHLLGTIAEIELRFFADNGPGETIATALRFTLSVPGVHTAIVGTKKPERWEQNARLLETGAWSEADYKAIRERWDDVAPKTWIGQT